MPFARPTLTALRNQARQDILNTTIADANGNQLVGLLRTGVLQVLAWVVAGLTYLLYGDLDWVARNSTPWGASEPEYLAGWGGLKGATLKDATAATVPLSFVGTAGVDVPAGTSITRNDGVLYTSAADAVVPAGATSVALTAVAVAPGALGNCPAGTTFGLTNSIAGINGGSGVATAAGTGGADQETLPDYKTRYLQLYAAPPQGGDRADYIEWALPIPGVTRAFVAPLLAGAGTVTVFFMMDNAEAANGGFPQGTNGVATNEPRDVAATGDQLTVANALFPLRPVTALVYAAAPTAQPVNFTISDLSPNTAPMQAAIELALQDMFLRLGKVGGTVDPDSGAAWGTIHPNDWNEAIAAVSGIGHFNVTGPAAPITPAVGCLFTVGGCSFSS